MTAGRPELKGSPELPPSAVALPARELPVRLSETKPSTPPPAFELDEFLAIVLEETHAELLLELALRDAFTQRPL